MAKTIVYAPGIHTGGGKTLLLDLLRALKSNDMALIDRRLRGELHECSATVKVLSGLRLQNLFFQENLNQSCAPEDLLICFANLPPHRRQPCYTRVFLQNRFLLENPLPHFGPRRAAELALLKILLNQRCSNADEWIVQGESMRAKLQTLLNEKSLPTSVQVQKIVPQPLLDRLNSSYAFSSEKRDQVYDFAYPAAAVPHKNHENLLQAWEILKAQGHRPRLLLLFPEKNTSQISYIKRIAKRIGPWVAVKEGVSLVEVQSFYLKCRALIFPSLVESFGLPLIEAHLHGLPVLAADLDYVQDLFEPLAHFDPNSPASIATAVIDFLNSKTVPPTQNPSQNHIKDLEPVASLLNPKPSGN